MKQNKLMNNLTLLLSLICLCGMALFFSGCQSRAQKTIVVPNADEKKTEDGNKKDDGKKINGDDDDDSGTTTKTNTGTSTLTGTSTHTGTQTGSNTQTGTGADTDLLIKVTLEDGTTQNIRWDGKSFQGNSKWKVNPVK